MIQKRVLLLKLKTLAEGETINIDTKSLIEKAEKSLVFHMAKKKKAISNALLNKVSIITGDLVLVKVRLLKELFIVSKITIRQDLSIAQLAPTGRAAKNAGLLVKRQ